MTCRTLVAALLFVISLGCNPKPSPVTDGGFIPEGDGGLDRPLQLNDLTLVLPLTHDAQDLDGGYLSASAQGSLGTLIPADLYTSTTGEPLTQSGNNTGIAKLPYDQLRVVALRLDPCFAHLAPLTRDTTCQPQVRVVFQPLKFDGTSVNAADAAIHAFYDVSFAELIDLANDITELRAAGASSTTADLGPLQPHPLIVAQGLRGAFAQGLARALLRYVGADNLVRLTRLRGGGDPIWHFDGFTIAHGSGSALVIPTLPDSATSVVFNTLTENTAEGGLLPESQSSDDLSLLASSRAATATAPERQAAFDAIENIRNPGVHTSETIDCATCHAADLVATSSASQFGLTPSASAHTFVADPGIPAGDLVQQYTSPGGTPNVHALSYRGTNLAINRRVINETAGLVAFLNQNYLKE